MQRTSLPSVPRAAYLDPPVPPRLPVPTPEHPILLSSSLGRVSVLAHPGFNLTWLAAILSMALVHVLHQGVALATTLLVANALGTLLFVRSWLRHFVGAKATTDGLLVESYTGSSLIPYASLLGIRGGRFPFQIADRWIEVDFLQRTGDRQTVRFFLDPLTTGVSKPLAMQILEARMQESKAEPSSSSPEPKKVPSRE